MAAKSTHGELYEAKDGIRWHLRARNGKILAESGEAYQEERKAIKAFDDVTGGQHPLKLLDGEVMEPKVEVIAEGAPAEQITAGAGPDGLPTDPNHPLYSPLSWDGNKK